MFPSEDGVQAVCVWEAGSVEDVRSFVESATAGRSWTRTGDWPAADQYGNCLKERTCWSRGLTLDSSAAPRAAHGRFSLFHTRLPVRPTGSLGSLDGTGTALLAFGHGGDSPRRCPDVRQRFEGGLMDEAQTRSQVDEHANVVVRGDMYSAVIQKRAVRSGSAPGRFMGA